MDHQVERFFALLTERALKRGVFRSVAELEKAITIYIEATPDSGSLSAAHGMLQLGNGLKTAFRQPPGADP
jgi:hypothetical protein